MTDGPRFKLAPHLAYDTTRGLLVWRPEQWVEEAQDVEEREIRIQTAELRALAREADSAPLIDILNEIRVAQDAMERRWCSLLKLLYDVAEPRGWTIEVDWEQRAMRFAEAKGP